MTLLIFWVLSTNLYYLTCFLLGLQGIHGQGLKLAQMPSLPNATGYWEGVWNAPEMETSFVRCSLCHVQRLGWHDAALEHLFGLSWGLSLNLSVAHFLENLTTQLYLLFWRFLLQQVQRSLFGESINGEEVRLVWCCTETFNLSISRTIAGCVCCSISHCVWLRSVAYCGTESNSEWKSLTPSSLDILNELPW